MAPSATSRRRKPIGQVLIGLGKVTQEQLARALAMQRQNGGLTGQILVDMGAATSEDVMEGLATQAGIECIDLSRVDIQTDAVMKVAGHVARTCMVMPLSFDNNALTVAMADPLSKTILAKLAGIVRCNIRAVAAKADDVSAAHRRYYPE